MRPAIAFRLLAIPLVWVPVGLVAWTYASTHDLARSARELQAGNKVTWPPAPTHGPTPAPIAATEHLLGDIGATLRTLAPVLVLLSLVVVVSRLLHRRARARRTVRWELRLGRDDLAEPYHVQEAFEGISGAISSRWYEQIWRGPNHFALEIHRLPDLSIRFTVVAPRELEPAVRGPLEDLYPDVELIEVDGQPDWAGCVVRLKKRASFVLSIQTTRNYEHAFCESLVAMLSTVEDELSVQLVLTPAPGLIHRRARRLLKRRERGLQHADRRDPGELGIDSIVEAKELKGALELQHLSLIHI